jgi:predicted O-methyltransferase YrrM
MRQDVRTHAHDLNGALGAILATADLHVRRDGDKAAARAAFESIVKSARRAGTLVESLTKAATADESGMDSAYERDLDYLERIAGSLDPVLGDLERSGRSENIPIVDRETGRLLSVLIAAKAPANILEIGTAYGYSTIWMARTIARNAKIFTIDPDRERTAKAMGFFQRAGVSDRIEICNKPALEVLPELPKEHFDIVFIDALKEQYSDYLRLSLPLLKKTGLVLADNLLWAHRASLVPGASDDASLKAIRRFNEELLEHPQLCATIVPVGDGVGVATKIG